jgi:hypothetical protein
VPQTTTLVGVVAEIEEIEEIRILGDLLGEIGLRRREGLRRNW